VIEGTPLPSDATCYGPVEPLGCFGPVPPTADANCIRRSDGALFFAISGTFAGPLTATGQFAECSDAEFERAAEAIGVTCDDPPEPDVPAPDAGASTAEGAQYSTQITNGIGCCDFYTLILADPMRDFCLFAEVRQEVGSGASFMEVTAVESADDCWNRRGEAGTAATAFSGEVSLGFVDSASAMTFELNAEFSNPPAWLPESVAASFIDLLADGEWYSTP
jgi:hypothetical protein